MAKLLIADDERNIAEGLQMLLQEEGYEVDTATDGNAAWKLIQETEYGLVLADLKMPKLDGIALLKSLREQKIPTEFVMITGQGSTELAIEAMKTGAYDYIQKPFKPDEIVLALRKAEERELLRREKFRIAIAGPTTATRMDKFTRTVLEKTGLIGMIGKSERGPAAIDAIRDHKAVYLMAVGGAAYLVSKAIVGAKVLAFADLGMEAIYEFEVKDMPVTVAVDSRGESVHQIGPRIWKAKIEEGLISVK